MLQMIALLTLFILSYFTEDDYVKLSITQKFLRSLVKWLGEAMFADPQTIHGFAVIELCKVRQFNDCNYNEFMFCLIFPIINFSRKSIACTFYDKADD